MTRAIFCFKSPDRGTFQLFCVAIKRFIPSTTLFRLKVKTKNNYQKLSQVHLIFYMIKGLMYKISECFHFPLYFHKSFVAFLYLLSQHLFNSSLQILFQILLNTQSSEFPRKHSPNFIVSLKLVIWQVGTVTLSSNTHFSGFTKLKFSVETITINSNHHQILLHKSCQAEE